VEEIARDRASSALAAADLAVMDLAEKVVDDAAAIEQADLEPLRRHGLSEDEITDVVLAAAARCFFSKTLDAVGVLPDARYGELPEELREVLVVGRPVAEG
jgi:alkylhydroperoxidase family enzyme